LSQHNPQRYTPPRTPGAPTGQPAVRVVPGRTAETAKIEYKGKLKLVAQWEADAALDLARGNPLKSLEIYDMILTAFPQYAKAWYNKAVTLHTALREFDKALYAYGMAQRFLPQNLDILHNKAKLLSEMRRNREALATYDQVLKANPDYLKSLEGAAALLINAGQPERAEPLLTRAVDIYVRAGRDPYRARQLLATALTNVGRSKEALKLIDTEIVNHPEDDSLWEARGIALSNMEDYREAVISLTRALRINNSNRFAWDTRQQLLTVCKQNKVRFSNADLAV
jgi:tetratricopeptide (TPR) repeat protein